MPATSDAREGEVLVRLAGNLGVDPGVLAGKLAEARAAETAQPSDEQEGPRRAALAEQAAQQHHVSQQLAAYDQLGQRFEEHWRARQAAYAATADLLHDLAPTFERARQEEIAERLAASRPVCGAMGPFLAAQAARRT